MFKKREGILETISFMALMAALTVIAAIIAAFFPIASVFILIFLPFFSASVALNCKWKYYPIYFVATIAVSLISLSWNMSSTVFYILPSLITGFLFGVCFTYKLSGIYSLLATSLFMCAITYAFIPLINFVYDTNLIEQFLKLFKLIDKPNIKIIVLSFIFLISFIQMLFSYIVLSNELKKFDYITENEDDKIIKYFGFIVSILVIPFVFFAPSFSYLFMFVSLIIMIYIFTNIAFKKNKLLIVLFSASILISVFLLMILFNVIKMPYALLVLNTANILIFVIYFIYNLCGDKSKC